MSEFEIELRRRFSELQARDERDAPDFGAMRDAALRGAAPPTRRASHWLTLGAIAAAAACVVLAFVAVQRYRAESHATDVWWTRDTLVDLTRFVSPTDGLLRSARHTVETRALFESVLDGVATSIQSTPFKGN